MLRLRVAAAFWPLAVAALRCDGVRDAEVARAEGVAVDDEALAVTAVDGINVVSGETAKFDQRGYVFDPWVAYDIAGWRKQYPLKYAKKGGLRAQYVLDRLDKLGGRDCIIFYCRDRKSVV